MRGTIESIAGPVLPAGGSRHERRSIKQVTCVIRPEKLDPVKDALNALNLVGGMTVSDVRGFGRQKGARAHFRGEAYRIRFLPKVKIELVIGAESVEEVMRIIRSAAQTGNVGDGKIFVSEVKNAMRIRTREQGWDAL